MSVYFVQSIGEQPDVFRVVGGGGNVVVNIIDCKQNATARGGVFCLTANAAAFAGKPKGE